MNPQQPQQQGVRDLPSGAGTFAPSSSYFPFVCLLEPLFSFKNLFLFNWRIIALQCCVGFCHTSTWLCHRYTYVLSLLNLPPPPSPSHRSRLLQSPSLSSLSHTENSLWLFVLHMVMYGSMLLSPYIPPSPSSPRLMCINLFPVCVCIAALPLISSVPSF